MKTVKETPMFKVGYFVRSHHGIKQLIQTKACGLGYRYGGAEYSFRSGVEHWSAKAGDTILVLTPMMPHISEVTYVDNELCVTSFKNGYDRICDVKTIPYIGQPFEEMN